MKRIGRYLLRGEVGSGQYGDVYRAYDPVLKRDVAIKIPSFDIRQHDLKKLLNSFQKEAETAARFLHPNIVAVYDVGSNKLPADGESDDYLPHYLVMEYVDGIDLKAQLKQCNHLMLKQTLDVIHHCCMALDYVHYQGVVHRDIKPGNILVNWEKRIFKLTDFGIADSDESRGSKSLGSLSYMTPEHFIASVAITPQSDIFALGSVMYELLSGHAAFKGRSKEQVANSVQHHHPRPVSEFIPDLPAIVDEVLARAMHKDPAKRYADALSFAKALREIESLEEEDSLDNYSGLSQYLNLREDSWFQHFTPDQISELLEVTISRDYLPGEYIIRENDEANDFYILVSGRVAVEKGGQHLLSMESGESFGEMGIQALRDRKRTADIKAEEDCNVLAVDINKLELLSDATRASLYRVFLETTMKRMSRITAEVIELRDKA